MTFCPSQKISLFDLFLAEEIQRVQDAFALASNVASVISAPDGTPLTRPSNFCETFAMLAHGRDAVETGHIFPASALRLSAAAGLTVHVCPLTDLLYAGMPIIVGECHVANWVIGQVRDEDMDKTQSLVLAERIGADPKTVDDALERMPRMSRARFGAVADSMALIAGHVFRQAYAERSRCMDEAEAGRRVRESEERFRAVFDSVSDAVFIHDWPGGALADANERAVSMFGYTREELQGMSLVDLCEDSMSCTTDIASLLDRGLAGGRGATEWRVRSKSGEVFRVEVSLRFTHVGGTPHVVACIRDVEERVCAEAAIIRERRFNEAVMDSVPGLLYLYDENGRLTRWNRQHSAVTGYSDEELAGMHLYDWYKGDPETIEKVRAAIARVYNEGYGYVEAMLRTKSGERIPFFFTAVRLEFDGKNYFTGIGIDISEHRKVDLDLQESEARYRSVIENIQDTFYRTDAGGALIMLSPSGASLLGYDTAEELFGMSMEKLWKSPEAFQEYVQILSEQGVVRALEATLLRRDGSEVVVEASSNIYRDESGFMLGLEGILRDISERKKAEREAERERMFTDAVMESVPGLLYIYDSQERMVRWNRNYEIMTGYSPEELLGSKAAAWFGGREPDTSTILTSFRQAMIEGRSEAEALLVTKEGSRIPCLFTAARHTIDGCAYLVGMGMDITERKKAEELLLQSEKKFAILFRHSPDAILLADIETAIVSEVNDTFVAMTGYTRDEIVGKTTGSINFYVDPGLWDRFYAMLRRDGQLVNQELMVRARDGHVLVCALSSHVLQIGEQRVVMSVFRNVTESKKMQEMMIQTEKMVSIGGDRRRHRP
jgi:PAS domain S-box-containing protein